MPKGAGRLGKGFLLPTAAVDQFLPRVDLHLGVGGLKHHAQRRPVRQPDCLDLDAVLVGGDKLQPAGIAQRQGISGIAFPKAPAQKQQTRQRSQEKRGHQMLFRICRIRPFHGCPSSSHSLFPYHIKLFKKHKVTFFVFAPPRGRRFANPRSFLLKKVSGCVRIFGGSVFFETI